MLTDDDLQSIYALAHFLHPAPKVALAVTQEAADRLALLERLQGPRPGPSLGRLPAAWRPQYCVYLRPGDNSGSQPTRDDSLMRYLKCLIWCKHGHDLPYICAD